MENVRRIYPLDPRELSEEELAVVFAMTSRNPLPFDQIANLVTSEKAADFHERWVLNYGHASVAEHAIIHMAVENISRLACDTLEDNRLASYTEKSSRYQILSDGSFHIPAELEEHSLRPTYISTCDSLFKAYNEEVNGLMAYLEQARPKTSNERDSAYTMRLRREATDVCRFLLPAATLTNVGVTLNARSMEHAVRKLLSSDLIEEIEVAEELKNQGKAITPTLIKYADRNDYLVITRSGLEKMAEVGAISDPYAECRAELVHHDSLAEAKLVTALLYRVSNVSYLDVWNRVEGMDQAQREQVIHHALNDLGTHDIPVRELETVDYAFDFVMDYGAYREFKRHRMQTYIAQPATVELGYVVPQLIMEAGLEGHFRKAMETAENGYRVLSEAFPRVGEYLVTHAHLRRVLSKINLRECYHLFKLRTSPQAHFTLRQVVQEAMSLAMEKHPILFKYLRLRDN